MAGVDEGRYAINPYIPRAQLEALLSAPLPDPHFRVAFCLVGHTWRRREPSAVAISLLVRKTPISATRVGDVLADLHAWGLLEFDSGERVRLQQDATRWCVPSVSAPRRGR